MNPVLALVLSICAAALSSDCGKSPVALNPPSVTLTGTWTGKGSDSQGPELMTWELMQMGNMVMGRVTTQAVDTSDGTCASCHKNKMDGTGNDFVPTSRLRMFFPSGGDVLTPRHRHDVCDRARRQPDNIATSYSGRGHVKDRLSTGFQHGPPAGRNHARPFAL
jgi:hypothetical protein